MNHHPTLYERIDHARRQLGLGESATLEEMEAVARQLLKEWHPDHGNHPQEECHARTRLIVEARQTLRSYCANHRFSFKKEEVDKQLSPEEWWFNRFGQEAVWQNGKSPMKKMDPTSGKSGKKPHE